MRALAILLRNILAAILAIPFNLLKLIGLRPSRPAWVLFELRDDPPHRALPFRERLAAALMGRRLVPDLHTISRRFEIVARTRKVRGVVLRVDGLSTSLSKIDSLAGMVAELRRAGKEAVIWTPHATSREARLLFAGDRLYISPAGRLEMQGFAVQAMAAAPALEWMGLGVTVVRSGRYKTAGEPLVSEEVSAETREMLDAILDDLHHTARGALVEGRGMESERVARLIDEAPWTGEQAKRAGIVDGVCYFDELIESLETEGDEPERAKQAGEPPGEAAGATEANGDAGGAGTKDESPAARDEASKVRVASGSGEEERRRKLKVGSWPELQASRLAGPGWKPLFASRRAIALVPLKGLIVEGESRQILGSSVVGHRTVSEVLAKARRASWARAVLLHIESRGGSALAADLIWREVRRCAEEKPVVAFIDTVAASGGYYCAAASSSIVASPLSLTASIGVISIVLETSKLTSRLGINREILQRGERAATGTSIRPPTAEELAGLESDVEAYYEIFLNRVAEGRPLTREEVAERAEGRVFTGRRAAELSLVDELGDFEAAVEKARALAGLPAGRPPPLSIIEAGGGPFGGSAPIGRTLMAETTHGPLAVGLGLDDFDLAWLKTALLEPGKAWAVMPHRLAAPTPR